MINHPHSNGNKLAIEPKGAMRLGRWELLVPPHD
jgi:hypothetical protein